MVFTSTRITGQVLLLFVDLRRLIGVRAFLANTAGAYDDEQPPILEQCLKLHDKAPYTGTDPFEFVVYQVSIQSDTVEAICIPAPEFSQTPPDTKHRARVFSTQSKQQTQGARLLRLGGIRSSP